MGRSRLPLELIPKEKSRKLTFQKRSMGIKKKIHEVSTLCGIDACLIIYGRSSDGFQSEPVFWPSNPEEVKSVINRYQHCVEEERGIKTSDLSGFFEEKIKQIQKEFSKLGPQGTDIYVYPTWDDRLNDLSIDQLRELLNSWGKKLEIVKSRVELLKKMNQTSFQASALMNPSFQNSLQYVRPINSTPLLPNPLMNDFNYASSYITLSRPFFCDQTPRRSMESTAMFNDSGPTTSYYQTAVPPPMMPYMPGQMMVDSPRTDTDYDYDFDDFSFLFK